MTVIHRFFHIFHMSEGVVLANQDVEDSVPERGSS